MRKFFILSLVLTSALLVGETQVSSPTVLKPPERLSADTPKTTVLGNAFVAPKDWSITVKGRATILEAPEGDSWIALVDVQAASGDEALTTAWKAYKPDAKWPVKVSYDLPDKDGWSRRRSYEYLTSPNEKRVVTADVYYSGSAWTVAIEDVTEAIGEKRRGQEALIFGRLLPKGYTRESFAGKKAHALDPARIAELGRFIEQGEKETSASLSDWYKTAE